MRTIALATALLLAAACTPAASVGQASADNWKPVPITPFLDEAVLGDPAAPVTIIEYASTTCPHCKAWHDEILPQIKAKYLDTHKARLFYRVLPTEPAEASVAGAAIARCVPKDQFFPVIDDLFARQEEVFTAARTAAGMQAELVSFGARHGLSPDEVRTCVTDKTIRGYIRKVVDDMPKFVDGTPTFIVNGTEVETPSLEKMSAALDAALATAPPPAAKP